MSLTLQNLIEYSNTAYNFLRKKRENADTKLGYAINRMGKPVEKALKPYKELLEEQQVEVDEINIRNASTDKTTGVLIYDTAKDEQGKETRNYKYTPENLVKRNKEIREVLKTYEAKVETLLESPATLNNPYFCTEIPSDLTVQEQEAFAGIVISTMNVSSAPTNGESKKVLEVV